MTAALPAQYPAGATALHWSGQRGTAGPFCWGLSCTPDQATAVRGETGTLTVRGEWLQPYVLGMSAGASRCQTLPFAYGALILDDPVVVVRFGVCGQPSPILACPSGVDTFALPIPAGIAPGVQTSIQAIVGVPGGPAWPIYAFTQAITFTVV